MMSDLPAQYYEGIASYPAQDCPYAYASEIGAYCAWWGGWADADRGLA